MKPRGTLCERVPDPRRARPGVPLHPLIQL